MKWTDTDTAIMYILAGVLGLAALFVLSGCGSSVREKANSESVQRDVFDVAITASMPVAQADGTATLVEIPITGKIIRDGSVITASEAKATTTLQGPELGPLIATAIKQVFPVAGALMGPAQPKDYTGEIITGILGMMTVAAGAAKVRADAKRIEDAKREAEIQRADANVAYDKLLAKPTDDHA